MSVLIGAENQTEMHSITSYNDQKAGNKNNSQYKLQNMQSINESYANN